MEEPQNKRQKIEQEEKEEEEECVVDNVQDKEILKFI